MKKAVVTGANGFIGTALCTELSNNGIEVIAVVKDKNENISRIEKLSGIRIVYCELSDFKNLGKLISDRDIDVMYHLAWVGPSGPLRGDSDVQTDNIRYSCDAVRASKKLGCKRFVFASSIMEYETEAVMQTELTPSINSLYATAKLAANYMIKAIAGNLGISYVRALISNIYGAGEKSPRLINTSIRKLINGEHCAFSAGEQLYDFIYITDAAKIFAGLGRCGKANKTYYIGSNPRPLKEFLLEMRDAVAPEAELGLGEIPFDGISLAYNEFDLNSVYEDIGIKPQISFKEGVVMTAEWIKEENYVGGATLR